MSTSPAYPTSAPLGSSMTADGAVICGPVKARREDVTDIRSKGLLPQLIEVLHALTEGQESLSRKVRNARLEHSCHLTPVVERFPQTEPPDFAGPRSFNGASPAAFIGTLQDSPSGNVELGARPTSIESFSKGSSAAPSIESSTAPISATVPDAAVPSGPSAAHVTHADTLTDLSSETFARTDWLNSVRPCGTNAELLNRDYNFFDALDARLADLKDADPAGDS